jgi:hypothetical protein
MMIVLGDLARRNSEWTTWCLWAVSLIMTISYSAMAYRSRSAGREQDKGTEPRQGVESQGATAHRPPE